MCGSGSAHSGHCTIGTPEARAFALLAAAGKKAGGNGVILRRHEAAYVSRGARRGERPAYIALVGTAISMELDRPACRFQLVDPVEFAQRSRAADKEQITTDNRAF